MKHLWQGCFCLQQFINFLSTFFRGKKINEKVKWIYGKSKI
jgi:hypothetical protein